MPGLSSMSILPGTPLKAVAWSMHGAVAGDDGLLVRETGVFRQAQIHPRRQLAGTAALKTSKSASDALA